MPPTPTSPDLLLLGDASPIPFLVSRASDGETLYANDAVSALVGLEGKDLVGRPSPDFYANPSDRDALLAALKKNGRVDNYEMQLKAEDGRVFWVMTTLVLSQMGGEAVILGGIYDLEKRREAEEALRQSEGLFRQLTDNINAVFWMRELATGKVLYCSPAFERIYGRRPDDLMARPDGVPDAVHPDDVENVSAMMEAAMREGRVPPDSEFRIVHPNGDVRWVRTRVFPVRDAEGSVYRVCGLTEDCTDRKQAETSLEQERNFVSAVLNTAGALVVVLNTDGYIVRWNRACEFLTGYTFDEVKDRPFWELVLLPEEVDRIRKVFEELAAGWFPNQAENHWVTKTGERRLISWSNTALLDEHGTVTHVVSTGIDITARQEALDALQAANEDLRTTQSQLVQSEKMAALGNLVAGIAHEINTPIGAIHSMHDTLVRAVAQLRESVEAAFEEGDAAGDSMRKALAVSDDANQVISTATERVMEIVRSLRSFARLDEAEMKQVDLHQGIDTTLTLVQHNLKNRVEVIKEYGDIPEIVCWPSRLNQVFLNILVNAGQAIQDTGQIRIKTSVVGKTVHVAFSDSGSGVPKENLERIFDPGFTTKGVGIGTGLGLSICYQIVADHKGRILVDSEVGKGTTFTVVIPSDLKEVPKEAAP